MFTNLAIERGHHLVAGIESPIDSVIFHGQRELSEMAHFPFPISYGKLQAEASATKSTISKEMFPLYPRPGMTADDICLLKFRLMVETEVPPYHYSMITLVDGCQWAPHLYKTQHGYADEIERNL
jgi:hypothetical protein